MVVVDTVRCTNADCSPGRYIAIRVHGGDLQTPLPALVPARCLENERMVCGDCGAQVLVAYVPAVEPLEEFYAEEPGS